MHLHHLSISWFGLCGHERLQRLLACGQAQELLLVPSSFIDALPLGGQTIVATGTDGSLVVGQGPLTQARWRGDRATITAGPIDLRLRSSSWHRLFLVHEGEAAGACGLLITDVEGLPCWFIGGADAESRADLLRSVTACRRIRHPLPRTPGTCLPPPLPANIREPLVEGWARMRNTHQFEPMLRHLGIYSLRAIQAVSGRFSQVLAVADLHRAAESMLDAGRPFYAFVANRAAIQIQACCPSAIEYDPGTAMTLFGESVWTGVDLAAIAEVWLVQRRSAEGPVHSIEAYDAVGHPVVRLLGWRPAGAQEDQAWRHFIDGIQKLSQHGQS
jgi:putative heme degradation protein